MNISSLGSTYPTQGTSGIVQNPKKDHDGDHDGAKVSSNGGGPFIQNVLQTLQSMGIHLPVTAKSDATGTSSSTDPSSGDQRLDIKSLTPDARQALHTFMHDLRNSLHQEGSGKLADSASSANGYHQLSSDLQNLIGSIGSTGSTSSKNAVGSALKADFSNLLKALSSNTQASTGNTSSNQPSLQDFLSKLNSQFIGQNDSTGSLINTTA
jgi:hypothetical protein